jgi:8-oxo-dGTP pyrophosphatase MutT (NUDIX family)
MANKVAIIIHHNNSILTGKETKYLSDIIKNIPLSLKTLTVINADQGIGKSRVQMIRDNLSVKPIFGDDIFQKRKLFKDGLLDAFIVYEEKDGALNFRYSIPEYEPEFQRTIVKGDIDRKDVNDKAAMLREVNEEIGIDIDESKLQLLPGSFTNKGYRKKNIFSVFTYELSDVEFENINDVITKRQEDYVGEIVDFKFTDIDHIYDTFVFNSISKKIIDAFWFNLQRKSPKRKSKSKSPKRKSNSKSKSPKSKSNSKSKSPKSNSPK